MRRAFMQAHGGPFSVSAMCRVLDVARSGYYAWKKREESRRDKENGRLDAVMVK